MAPNANENAAAHYARRLAESATALAALSASSARLSLVRLVLFVAWVGLAIDSGRTTNHSAVSLGLAVAVTIVFVLVALVHGRVIERRRRAEASHAWAAKGAARLEGRWRAPLLPSERSAHAVADDHPYAHDLDIVGEGSLLQALDTTKTHEGRARLASWLLAPASAAEIRARQGAVVDLAARPDFLEALAVEGACARPSADGLGAVVRWAAEAPTWAPSIVERAAMIVLPIVTVGSLVFGADLPFPRALWAATGLVQLAMNARRRRETGPTLDVAAAHHEALERVAHMLVVVEALTAKDPRLASICARVRDLGGSPASRRVARLGTIVGFAEARRNGAFRMFIGPLLLWDLHAARALDRWRADVGKGLGAALDALAEIEALAALATRAFERPNDAFATIVDGDVVGFDGRGLAHPLLASERAVRNDVALGALATPGAHDAIATKILLVTGSNMSGKSTLLRSVGANVVLAMSGAPTTSRALTLTPLAVVTSMRIRDSLEEGVSHFLAELRRLKQVVDATERATAAPATAPTRPPAALYLLDEILHGTNSRERDLGARGVLTTLSTKRAIGAVSTHDLALASLADALPGAIHLAHFREQITKDEAGVEAMTFDYTLRPGVVATSNALRLMRIVGLEIGTFADPETQSS